MRRLLAACLLSALVACSSETERPAMLSTPIPADAVAFDSPIGPLYHDDSFIYTNDPAQCAQIKAAAVDGKVAELVGLDLDHPGMTDWGYICADG